jgi:hypothetical protein
VAMVVTMTIITTAEKMRSSIFRARELRLS